MHKKIIVGNWKMNPSSIKEAEILFKAISTALSRNPGVDVVICPPSLYLHQLLKVKNKYISLGAQNAFYESSGAFTGEVSPIMLRASKVTHVIVGHSERRSLGETNEIINKKLNALSKAKITSVLCIGEKERSNDGAYLQVVKEQLIECLKGLSKSYLSNIIIAYEPVWALSTTVNRHDATPHDFEEMKIYIRKLLTDIYGRTTALSVRIIYGGSVSKDNAESFFVAGADGLLPGKASLQPKNFAEIISIASKFK